MPDAEISMLDRCSGRQLKELLALASIEAKTAPDWLLEVGDVEALEYLLAQLCAETGKSAGVLLQGVCCAETPVEILLEIKSAAKRMAAAAVTPAQKAAATLLYHLSVAAALGRYGRNISSKDPAARLPLYRELAVELADEELAGIFERAIARCSS